MILMFACRHHHPVPILQQTKIVFNPQSVASFYIFRHPLSIFLFSITHSLLFHTRLGLYRKSFPSQIPRCKVFSRSVLWSFSSNLLRSYISFRPFLFIFPSGGLFSSAICSSRYTGGVYASMIWTAFSASRLRIALYVRTSNCRFKSW